MGNGLWSQNIWLMTCFATYWLWDQLNVLIYNSEER